MSELEDLRKLIGIEKVTKTRKSMREQLIITEYGKPSKSLAKQSQFLKSLPTPKHTIGDIVIVPPAIYGVVQFYLYEDLHGWVYAITLEDDSARVHYFPEKSLVKRG